VIDELVLDIAPAPLGDEALFEDVED